MSAEVREIPGQRVFDVLVASVALAVLSPFLVGLAIAVKASSGGPIFFHGTRVGRGGRPFRILKFRTMRTHSGDGEPGITRAGDARVTGVGQWLRRAKLDELPQLFNVLRGEMSLVGPRPEDPRYAALFAGPQRAVLEARPGMTSPASARYRHEEQLLERDDWESYYRSVVLPDKLRIDLEYLRNRTLWTDVRMLATTLASLFRRPEYRTNPRKGVTLDD